MGNPHEGTALVTIQGVAELGRLVAEQPLPTEVAGEFSYTADYVNQSFKPAVRCITAAMRHEDCVHAFMANTSWYERFLMIVEEF